MFLKRLKTFQVVAEELNFTQAALKLNYTQSTVSKHMQSLEEELNTELLIREGGSYQLTKAGQQLYQHSRVILNELKGINELAHGEDKEMNLVIQGHNYYCYEFVIPAIERLKSLYPKIHFQVKTSNNQDTVNRLIKGEIDIGIVSGNLLPRNFESYPIAYESVGLCVGEKLFNENYTVEDYISRYPIIIDESDMYQSSNVFPYVKKPLDIIDTDSDEVVQQTLLRNKFIGVVRLGRLKKEINSGKIIVVDKIIKSSPINLVVNKENMDNAQVSAFISVIRKMQDPSQQYHVRFR